MKSKTASRRLVWTLLLVCLTVQAQAEEKASGSFFGRARKPQTVKQTAQSEPAEAAMPVQTPASVSTPVTPQARKKLEEDLATKGVSLTEIEEKGLTSPPRIPGIEDYDLSRVIPSAPSAPAGPPEPNKGYLVRRAAVNQPNQELPEAPERFISAAVAPSSPPGPIKESPTQPAAVQPVTIQTLPDAPQGLASAPRALPIIPELKKETALPRSMPSQSVQVPRSTPKPQVPTPKTPPLPSKRKY